MLIRIVPIGKVEEGVLSSVKEGLESALGIRCRLGQAVDLPVEAYNRWRRQFDAEKVIDRICSAVGVIDRDLPVLGITGEDIYYDGLNFVFGLEDPAGFCLVSIARLRPEFYGERPNFDRLVQRSVKEALHEIGHYLGLSHCRSAECVMSFSACVEDIDRKKTEFCPNCRVKMATKGINI